MLITVESLRESVRGDLPALVLQLQEATGRYGAEEAYAWSESLPRLCELLSAPSMQPLHLYCGGKGDLALEYQLPASASWADVVLLGAHVRSPSAVIIELKNWLTRADRPGAAEGLIERQGRQELHPSEQVRGYVEYCRRFHSAVQDANAAVHGCVLFTRDFVVRPYIEEPNATLATNYPIFTLSREDLGSRAPKFLEERLVRPDWEFASAFEKGAYRQQRGFVQQIARQVLEVRRPAFELLDNQRRAFALCKAVVDEVVHQWTLGDVQRRVVVVKGPPGSGKSAIAARLWAEVSLKQEVPPGDIVFVTTSLSQNTNWAHLFTDVGPEGARGVIRKASACHPISTHRVGRLRQQHGNTFLADVTSWRENLQTLASIGEPFQDGARDMQQLVSIVDEAHSLVNPEREGGVGQFGFAPTLGPQAYQIIRCSALTVLFLDPAQGFRHRENTTFEDLRMWARELGAGEIIEVSLEGVQFRCAGSTEYVAWVESFLSGASLERDRALAATWHVPQEQPASPTVPEHPVVVPLLRASEPKRTYIVEGNVVVLRQNTRRRSFDFRVFENPIELEGALLKMVNQGATARLLSTYSRPWTTRDHARPHDAPPSQRDFCEEVDLGPKKAVWSKVWNVVPSTDDYSHFVQGAPGSAVAHDPLCEVGCPYAVRGFDYDYVGVLWLEDLVWRAGTWRINRDHVHESGLSTLVRRVRHEPPGGRSAQDLMEKVKQAYRIVLTRGLKGLFVWVKDEETRRHLRASLGELSASN
jgi:uncharacterized protein